MNQKMMESQDISQLCDKNLFRTAVEFRQAHTLLRSSKSDTVKALRDELESALSVIELELRSRGIDCPGEYYW